ncbi:hypothetical protein [Microbacterium sp. KRD172]|nr:hypothetical protein [Microbacterium sp. KRD172]
MTPAVFLASIPVALLVDANSAKLAWAALMVLNPVVAVLLARRPVPST